METAFRDHINLTIFGHVGQDFTRALVENARSDRHFNGDIFTAFTGTVAALTVSTALSTIRFHKAEIDQRIEVLISNEIHITTITTVATVRAATLDAKA